MTGDNRFYDLEISSAGDTFTAGVAVQVENNLTVSGGTLDFGNSNLTMGNTGSSSIIEVMIGQTLTQNSGLTTFVEGGGTHILNGPGDITLGDVDIGIDGSGSVLTLYGIGTTLTVKGVLHIHINNLQETKVVLFASACKRTMPDPAIMAQLFVLVSYCVA